MKKVTHWFDSQLLSTGFEFDTISAIRGSKLLFRKIANVLRKAKRKALKRASFQFFLVVSKPKQNPRTRFMMKR